MKNEINDQHKIFPLPNYERPQTGGWRHLVRAKLPDGTERKIRASPSPACRIRFGRSGCTR